VKNIWVFNFTRLNMGKGVVAFDLCRSFAIFKFDPKIFAIALSAYI
jgi:hypothetical protein